MSQKIHLNYVTLKITTGRNLLSYIDGITIHDRLICPKCKDILIEPYQTPCGCRLCLSCLGDLTEISFNVCPGCNHRWSQNDRCIYDRAIERNVNDLKMNCINEGCKYNCKLRQLMDHLGKCAYRAEKCQQCVESYHFIDRDRHKSNDCKMMKVKCSDCNLELTKQDLEEVHRNGKGNFDHLCSNWKGMCPFRCSEDVQENIKAHLIDCSRLVSSGVMEDQLVTELRYHTDLMVNELTILRKENEDLKYQVSESCRTKDIQIVGLHRTINDLSEQIDKLTKKLKGYESKFTLDDKENVPGFCYSVVMTEGDCLWKVSDIRDKISRAKKRGDAQLCSDPFYSTSPRYRLCLKMYPNGDGSGFGTHVSIFFVIMKGEYDDEVPWPFCRKISISLVTNKKGKMNHVKNIKAGKNEHFYGKPNGKVIVVAGAPQFISHDELFRSDDFVDNESITILAAVN